MKARPIGFVQTMSKNDKLSTPPAHSEALPSKPADSIKIEQEIRDDLLRQGIEQKIVDAVMGYRPEDIPFVYSAGDIWIGTTDALYNLRAGGREGDRTPEVIVQWMGPEFSRENQITRQEVRHLGDGRILSKTYTNVSKMGAFDGKIKSISLNIPAGKHQDWVFPNDDLIYEFKERDGKWSVDLKERTMTHGSMLLNGYSQVIQNHMHEVALVKGGGAGPRRFAALAEKKGTARILNL